MQDHPIRPIYVVGCPRSGTTLVGNLLAAAETAFNGEESFFLQLMSYWKSMLKPPVAPLTRTFMDQAERLMREVIGSACAAEGKAHYVDHTPAHALCLDDVWELFPSAKVVHVVRHPGAVVQSLSRSYAAGYEWAGSTVADRVTLWRQHVRAVAASEADERLRTLRYEDLCSRPIQETEALFAWAGLPWNQSLLDEFTRPHVPDAGKPFALAKRTPGGLKFRSLPKLNLSPDVLSALENVEPEMQYYGYSVAD